MNINELAKEAGFDWHTGWTLEDDAPNRFEAFANLVAAAARADEREACAKLFDNQNIWDEEVSQTIRARGTT
jgi:hypothetical protein